MGQNFQTNAGKERSRSGLNNTSFHISVNLPLRNHFSLVWHIFSLAIVSYVMKKYKLGIQDIDIKGMNKILAYAASLMLAGISPEVCESTITEVYCSVKKSISVFFM